MAFAQAWPAHPAALLRIPLLACLALACASDPPAPAAGESARDGRRGVLAKTTPTAAAAAAQTPDGPASGDGDDPDAKPGRMLIYSAITGHTPLDEQNPDDPTARYRTPAEREAARARRIEAEIEAEMAKEEALRNEPEVAPQAPAPSPAPFDAAANPMAAPVAPELRELPATLFETREVSIPPGQWQNRRELQLVRRSLDADGDGAPEEVRYVDPASGRPVRVEMDLDFDGEFDSWTTYEAGQPAIRVLDTNGDAAPDTWERFADGRLEAKTLDRDHDTVKDTFFRYTSGELTELLRDANNDGTVDRVERYSGLRRERTEEDQTLNGFMDTWTVYSVVDGREVVASVERDSRDQGKPNVFETYETEADRTLLARKEEDLDGDGSIDVVSTYEDGRLVQRAISDEALSPL